MEKSIKKCVHVYIYIYESLGCKAETNIHCKSTILQFLKKKCLLNFSQVHQFQNR